MANIIQSQHSMEKIGLKCAKLLIFVHADQATRLDFVVCFFFSLCMRLILTFIYTHTKHSALWQLCGVVNFRHWTEIKINRWARSRWILEFEFISLFIFRVEEEKKTSKLWSNLLKFFFGKISKRRIFKVHFRHYFQIFI